MIDAPIGTQTPMRRITEPEEVIAALERAVPGLAEHRRPEPAVLDWALLEGGLGTALPADYKRLAEWYSTFAVGDSLLVGLPEPGEEQYLLRGIRYEEGGAVPFLAEYCNGTLEPWVLPPGGPEVTPC